MQAGRAGTVRELTVRGIILGALITAIFTASNVYLGLKIGLTFASSIPAAVISMAVLRAAGGAGVLENNMVQTQASAAGTLSSIIFVLPALVMAGIWQGFAFWPVAIVCVAGGMLGVLFTIPLRRALVTGSDLPYPEGVAAAEVLRVGAGTDAADRATQRESAVSLVIGTVLSAVVALATGGFRLLADGLTLAMGSTGPVFRLTSGFSLALLGAGYLVGLAGGIAMLVGLVIAWGVLTPYLTALLPHPAGVAPAAFALDVWKHRVRFIGAGTIGIAALWTLGTLAGPVAAGLRDALRGGATVPILPPRHPEPANPDADRDLSPKLIGPLALVLVAVLFAAFLAFLPAPYTAGPIGVALLAALFCAVFGFVIAAACGYMAGIVGSSSSPISGIAILAVLSLSLLVSGLLDLGWLPGPAQVTRPLAVGLVIFVATAVLAAATISNDNLQDLKTGQLVGASPWKQQVALMIGCVSGAVVIPPVLNLLYNAYGFAGAMPHPGMDPEHALAAPQATLMASLASGVVLGSQDWTPIVQGVGLGALLIAVDLILRRAGARRHLRLPPLAVGIGLYLPPEVTVALVVGAIASAVIAHSLRHRPEAARNAAENRAVMLASGLIVGESLMGVVLAGIVGGSGRDDLLALVGPGFAPGATVLGAAVFCAVTLWFAFSVIRRGRA
ncbi:OPT family oligopeptide transporter [Endobacter medicaginis]